tara:strand:- start:858 stop:1262 length:405 start_codon:yes stop_codon:yes gene_type:complete
MGYWTTSIEAINDGPEQGAFYIGSTEYCYDEINEVTDFDEPAESAGRVFYSEHEARMFAAEHGIPLSDDRDFDLDLDREVAARRAGLSLEAMRSKARALTPRALRRLAQHAESFCPFANAELIRREGIAFARNS